MTRTYDIITIIKDIDAMLYVALHPELPGCMAQGETAADAMLALEDVRADWLAHYREHGLPIPPPGPATRTGALGHTWQCTVSFVEASP